MPRIHSSIWLGVGMLVFAAALALVFIPQWVITPANVRKIVLSPDFWPYIVAGLLAIGGAALLAQYYFVSRITAPLSEEDPAPAGGGLRVALVGVLMVVYYLILGPLGMVWSSVIAYLGFMAIIGLPRKVSSAIIAVVLPIALYMFFSHVAGVPIPQAKFLALP